MGKMKPLEEELAERLRDIDAEISALNKRKDAVQRALAAVTGKAVTKAPTATAAKTAKPRSRRFARRISGLRGMVMSVLATGDRLTTQEVARRVWADHKDALSGICLKKELPRRVSHVLTRINMDGGLNTYRVSGARGGQYEWQRKDAVGS